MSVRLAGRVRRVLVLVPSTSTGRSVHKVVSVGMERSVILLTELVYVLQVRILFPLYQCIKVCMFMNVNIYLVRE